MKTKARSRTAASSDEEEEEDGGDTTETDTDVEGLEYSQTQRSSQPGEWFEILEIIAEKPTRYRVLWKGTDPATGEAWKPEWVRKSCVTDDAREEWEAKKRDRQTKKKKKKKKKKKGKPRDDDGNSPDFIVAVSHIPPDFDRSQYQRFDPGDILLAPSTQTDSEFASSPATVHSDEDPIEWTQQQPVVFGSQRVIPDSQPEEKETPPPSYLESISQSTQRSALQVSSQLVEAAVQTSPPLRETQLPEEEWEWERADSYDLDLPPLSLDRREESPSPPARRVSSSPIRQGTPAAQPASRHVGSDKESTSAGSREDESVDKEPPASLGEVDFHEAEREETPENPPEGSAFQGETPPNRPESPVPVQTEAEAQSLPPQVNPKAREVKIGPPRRQRLFVNANFENWFRRTVNDKRRSTTPPTPELPSSSSFPLPPDTILPYSNLDSPELPPVMSDIPLSPSLPAQPGSLRAKLEARKRGMEQELVGSRSSSVAPGTPRQESVSNLPPVPQWTSQDAQVTVPPQTQDSATREGSTPAPQAIQERKSSSPSLSSAFGSPSLGAVEYAVLVPLSNETNNGSISQLEVYRQQILKKHADVDNYLADYENASQEVKESAFQVVRSAALIATHPHLVYPVAALSDSDEREAEYHAMMSAKFRFLKDLFAVIKEENLKIAIVAEAPKCIDLLEVFFRGIKIDHKRLDKLSERPPMSDDDIEGMVTVFLVPSQPRSGAVGIECHVVIAMDSTFAAHSPEIVQIRANSIEPTKIAPVLRLLAVNTIEHALLCVSPITPNKLYACVEVMKALRDSAGVMDPAYEAAMGNTAHKVGEWIGKKCEGELKAPALPELPLSVEPSSQTQPTSEEVQMMEINEKRKRQDSLQGSQAAMDVEAKKRRVLDKIPTPSETAPADVSHVSDSMPSQTPPSPIPEQPMLAIEPAPEHPMLEPAPEHPMIESSPENQTSESTSNGAEPTQVTDESPEPDVAMEIDDDNETESEPEPELAYVFARPVAPILDTEDQPLEEMSHADLVSMLKQRNEDLKAWMASQARLQSRFEELQQVLRDRKSEIKAHERTAKIADARRDRALADVEKLQAQKAALNEQIQDTLALLKAGNPEMSALAAENKELKRQLESANNKIAAAEKEAGFVREQYQNASQAVFEVRRECQELQKENEALKRQADVRVVALRQLATDNAIEARDQEIEELKMRIKEKDERCARLAVREGTYGLKRGSVPRRIGSPAQSRGSSPSVAGRRPG